MNMTDISPRSLFLLPMLFVVFPPLLITCEINDRMPTDAVIPSTPLSLLPFLNKINEQWSSDLETPQAQQPCTKLTTSSTGGVIHSFIHFVYTLVYCILAEL